MQDRPTFGELLEAVRQFLETEIQPSKTDPRARFRTLVAINALTILQRELLYEDDAIREEAVALLALLDRRHALPLRSEERVSLVLALNAELSRRIRGGDTPDGTREHLIRVGAHKLRVGNPQYLGSAGCHAAASPG
jgi:hypothetical protein